VGFKPDEYSSKTGKAKGFLKKGVEVTGTMLPPAFDIIKAKGIELDADNVSNAIGGLLSVKDTLQKWLSEEIPFLKSICLMKNEAVKNSVSMGKILC